MSLDEKLEVASVARRRRRLLAGVALLRRLWQRAPLPVAWRRITLTALDRAAPRAKALIESSDVRWAPEALIPRPPQSIRPGRLVVSGFLAESSGVGRGARMSLAAFRAAGLSPVAHDLRREPGGWGVEEPGGVWFAHCNAPEAAAFLLRSPGPAQAYRVGYWAWELPALPPAWGRVAALFHEVWTPSHFVAAAVRGTVAGHVRVRVVPHPLPAVETARPARDRFALPEDAFVFLSMYDARSSSTRKNPQGAVRAFQQAFRPADANVQLVVKAQLLDNRRGGPPDGLLELISGWPNIRVLAETLTDQEALDLVASADAFVSLHRSEGFGLAIAEALALGRPVIATDWSGNVDFAQAGVLRIGYALGPVRDPTGVYDAPGQVWAEPDLSEGAAAMRALAGDRVAARLIGRAGRRNVRARLPLAYPVAHLQPWLDSLA